jgi:hypothetical protein
MANSMNVSPSKPTTKINSLNQNFVGTVMGPAQAVQKQQQLSGSATITNTGQVQQSKHPILANKQ